MSDELKPLSLRELDALQTQLDGAGLLGRTLKRVFEQARRALDKPAWPTEEVSEQRCLLTHSFVAIAKDNTYEAGWTDCYDWLTQHVAPAKEKE